MVEHLSTVKNASIDRISDNGNVSIISVVHHGSTGLQLQSCKSKVNTASSCLRRKRSPRATSSEFTTTSLIGGKRSDES
jgi:hypothetical protein